MKHAPDMRHPTVDEFAAGLFIRTPQRWWVAIGVPEAIITGGEVWENCLPEIREVFRARALQALRGDFSVMPWQMAAERGEGLLWAMPQG